MRKYLGKSAEEWREMAETTEKLAKHRSKTAANRMQLWEAAEIMRECATEVKWGDLGQEEPDPPAVPERMTGEEFAEMQRV